LEDNLEYTVDDSDSKVDGGELVESQASILSVPTKPRGQ
jgi:hypothetical protein